jgi:hypothetical protein
MTERYDERESVRVDDDGSHVREVKVREDLAAQQRESVSRVTQLIGLVTSAVEVLIGLRVFLRLIAANPGNSFAQMIYGLSEVFVWPFNGLTGTPAAEGFVLDIPAIIAMFVYAVAAWLLIQLVWILFNRRTTSRISTYERD